MSAEPCLRVPRRAVRAASGRESKGTPCRVDSVQDRVTAAFKVFDEDMGGTIDSSEMRRVMKLLGYTITISEAKQMVS